MIPGIILVQQHPVSEFQLKLFNVKFSGLKAIIMKK